MDVARLAGRTAVVTGAGSGIGRASALAFARRGANLAICDIGDAGLAETEAAARALGVEVLARRVDVAQAAEMQAFADAVHAQVESVDLLMNNAGVGLAAGMLETSLDDWRWIVDINLFGVVHGIHCFVPAMVRRARGGHVVNVASMAGTMSRVRCCRPTSRRSSRSSGSRNRCARNSRRTGSACGRLPGRHQHRNRGGEPTPAERRTARRSRAAMQHGFAAAQRHAGARRRERAEGDRARPRQSHPSRRRHGPSTTEADCARLRALAGRADHEAPTGGGEARKRLG